MIDVVMGSNVRLRTIRRAASFNTDWGECRLNSICTVENNVTVVNTAYNKRMNQFCLWCLNCQSSAYESKLTKIIKNNDFTTVLFVRRTWVRCWWWHRSMLLESTAGCVNHLSWLNHSWTWRAVAVFLRRQTVSYQCWTLNGSMPSKFSSPETCYKSSYLFRGLVSFET